MIRRRAGAGSFIRFDEAAFEIVLFLLLIMGFISVVTLASVFEEQFLDFISVIMYFVLGS